MKQALLVIDVQSGMFDQAPFPDDMEAVLERINGLAERARAAGAPVIWVQHESPAGLLGRGGPGWQLAAGLRTADGDRYLAKTTPDSFLRTELDALLKQLGVEGVAICGYASEFCVDTTTRSALARGIPVTLAGDAHTTHDKPHAKAAVIRAHHSFALGNLSSFGTPIAVKDAADIAFD
ncbi:cysteine hydrolase family protein [Chromobacterium phragmitis]|uniref:Cysteine hydrolase n=1 Tax=Chromobacterium phragmitis TaxID=2202141 RepID=A0A344UJC0_9NEIS|nr:cysteine hydrolase family protein [Chromobacterium phragmitis]AXE35368.1 cysteine hydrolase [Chromobacterium phragmitis]